MASFQNKLKHFIDHKWDEPEEIGFVEILREHLPDMKIRPDLACKDYLAKVMKDNQKHMQMFSDEFLEEFENLLGS